MRRKYRMLTIRIISLISSLIILVSGFTVSASASSVETEDAFSPTVLNLLDYPEFEWKQSSSEYAITDVPSIKFLNNNGSYIRWGDNDSLISLSTVTVGIAMESRPETVRFVFGGIQYLGSLVGTDTGVYYYSFEVNSSANDYFQLWVMAQSGYRSSMEIISCVAYLDNCFSIGEINVEFYGQQDEEEQFFRQSYYSGGLAVPFNYDNFFESSATAPDQFFVELGYVFHSQNLDSFSIMFSSTNIWPNYYDQDSIQQGGFRLMEGDSEVAVLPYSVTDSVMTYFYEGCVQYVYTLTVDLSGYDLTGKSILFNSYMGAVYPNTSSSSTYTMYQFELMAAGYRVDVNSQAWYLRFFNWIKKEFTDLKQTIVNNGVKGSLDQAGESLGDSIDNAVEQENAVNEAVSQLQSDWTAEHGNLSLGFESTLLRSKSGIEFLSDYAQRIFENMGWFGSVYMAVGMMSVLMLILSKSGLAHKLTHYSTSVRSGPHTGSNGGIK